MQTRSEQRPSRACPAPVQPAPAPDHPTAYAALSRDPRHLTGLEICRADVAHETGECPPPGPWSPCSAAAGLTEAYLDHLAMREPDADPGSEAELAYAVEQFVLSHAVGKALYVALPEPIPSPWPGRPYVAAYVIDDLPRSHPEDPVSGILLVAEPDGRGGFLDRYRSLNRAAAYWRGAGERRQRFLGRLPAAARTAASSLLPSRARLRA